MCLLPHALARAVPQRRIVIKTLIWIGMKCLKMPLPQMLKLQTSKTGFKLRTHSRLANDSPH